MPWRCVSVQRQLALLVGGDLPEEEESSVETHVGHCASCRMHLASLRRSRERLLNLQASASSEELETSVWPAIRVRLLPIGQERRPERSWLPIGAMMAASIAIGVVLWNRPEQLQPVRSIGPDTALLPEAWGADASVDSFSTVAPYSTVSPGRSAFIDESVHSDPYFHLERARPVGLNLPEF